MNAEPTVVEPVTFAGLRQLARCGGCAAKSPPEAVELLGQIAMAHGARDDRVLVGLRPADDAAVYALDTERALVATVDFFPPLVDDPGDYGAIAAANAVSDVYAMGGEVAFALAISGFPASLPNAIVARVAAAAAAVVRDSGGFVLGGHSIRCAEPIFGLCVLGFVHPDRIWRKRGAQPGDRLWLSKPLGTGILLSSGTAAGQATAVESMRATNQRTANALRSLATPIHAVTDVSGYGLLGHLTEMLEQSALGARLSARAIPLLRGAHALAASGVRTSVHRRADRQSVDCRYAATVDTGLQALLRDPQTSGGLLVSAPAALDEDLHALGLHCIGECLPGPVAISID